jgi:Polyketide cyclase / dehydrase and lipid transport
MWTVILIILAIIVILLAMGFMRPAEFSVARQADYKASPDAVFKQINNFHHWAAWSPWEKLDPHLHRNYTGPEAGVGAKYAWVGNKKVGEGNMEITQSEPAKRLLLDLHFLKPFKANNVTEFTLTPKAGLTTLRWEMRGQTPFMFRVLHTFMNMDKMVGKDFEKGLANLRSIVEA